MKYIFSIALLSVSVVGFVRAQIPMTSTPASQMTRARSSLRMIASTQYTPHTELFAKYDPLIKDVPGQFTAYLTQVGETFKPYTEAEVTLTLTVNGKTAYQETLKQPVTPGIYRFPIKSEVAGTGRVTIAIKMPTYSEGFMFERITVYADEAAALARQARSVPEMITGLITFSKQKSWGETFATVCIGETKGALMIPKKSVLTDMGTTYVYVQHDPEHFRKQAVRVGKQEDHTVEIVSGLQAGERIVSVGSDKIR